jgi:pyruvate dehydrogenase E2 component (dihydrolipoamide acetyltransferase)
MTTQVLLPKLGNTVESSIIVAWLKQPGERVAEGDALCTVETDKSTLDVPSTASGVLVHQLVKVGDDVPVLAPIAVIGDGRDLPLTPTPLPPGEGLRVSPRARALAQETGVDVSRIAGTGPNGRIIERDVQAALASQPKLTPVAKAMIERGGYVAPERGSGPGGRITKDDLMPVLPTALRAERLSGRGEGGLVDAQDYDVIPLPNIRRVIAERMRASLHSTAQLTLHASADARALLDYRQRLKASDEALGLRGVTINDLVLFAVARTLPSFPQLNATFNEPTPDPSLQGRGAELRQYKSVHLGFAVDTPRGLLVPVIRDAATLTLKQLAETASQLAKAAQAGALAPDALSGSTFTVTNLGGFGIESFTPILNAPQVAVLGVGNINLKAVEMDGEIQHIPHIGLSLTIDHQIVDGAPGAKFLQALARNLAQIDLLLAV